MKTLFLILFFFAISSYGAFVIGPDTNTHEALPANTPQSMGDATLGCDSCHKPGIEVAPSEDKLVHHYKCAILGGCKSEAPYPGSATSVN